MRNILFISLFVLVIIFLFQIIYYLLPLAKKNVPLPPPSPAVTNQSKLIAPTPTITDIYFKFSNLHIVRLDTDDTVGRTVLYKLDANYDNSVPASGISDGAPSNPTYFTGVLKQITQIDDLQNLNFLLFDPIEKKMLPPVVVTNDTQIYVEDLAKKDLAPEQDSSVLVGTVGEKQEDGLIQTNDAMVIKLTKDDQNKFIATSLTIRRLNGTNNL